MTHSLASNSYSNSRRVSVYETLRKDFHSELHFAKYSFCHGYPGSFVASEWQVEDSIDCVFVIYRILHMLLVIFLITVYITNCPENMMMKIKQLVYLTNWTYVLIFLTSFMGIVCIISESISRSRRTPLQMIHPPFSFVFKLYWVLHAMAVDMSFAISLGYWLYMPFSKQTFPLVYDIYHIWCAILMLMDLFIVAIPMRLFQGYASLMFAICYSVFTYVYAYYDGTSPYGAHNLYPILRWKTHPLETVGYICGCLAFLAIMRCITYGLYKTRHMLFKWFYLVDELSTGSSLSLSTLN